MPLPDSSEPYACPEILAAASLSMGDAWGLGVYEGPREMFKPKMPDEPLVQTGFTSECPFVYGSEPN